MLFHCILMHSGHQLLAQCLAYTTVAPLKKGLMPKVLLSWAHAALCHLCSTACACILHSSTTRLCLGTAEENAVVHRHLHHLLREVSVRTANLKLSVQHAAQSAVCHIISTACNWILSSVYNKAVAWSHSREEDGCTQTVTI